jgi:hypothetical protein
MALVEKLAAEQQEVDVRLEGVLREKTRLEAELKDYRLALIEQVGVP